MRIDRVKLIAEMARKDMNVSKLAAQTGLARATVTAVRGGKSCNDNTASRIAKALGVDVTELMLES